MKKYSIVFLVPLIAFLLSSCSMHLGLGKLFNSGSSQPTKAKHIKATHTPPSPPTATPAGSGSLLATPAAANAITVSSASNQFNNLPVKAGNAAIGANIGNAMPPMPSP